MRQLGLFDMTMQMTWVLIARRVLGFGFAIALGIASLTPRTGHPQAQVSVPAEMTILEQITITEVTALNLGTVVAPTNATTTFSFDVNGTTSAPTGGDGSYVGGQIVGEFLVDGANGENFTFTPTAGGACTVAGVTLTGLSDNAVGTFDETPKIGATWTVAVGVTGSGTCPFTLMAAQP